MVFLGISIEGIACCRSIEVLEKRGLLSQARWAGGAVARAINPAPLSSLNFRAYRAWAGCKLSLLKHTFQRFAKGKINGFLIDNESINKTTKCPSDRKCLTDKKHLHFRPESAIKEYGIFIAPKKSNSRPYKLSFGNGTICKSTE